jgi:PhnB protein
MSIQPYLFFDGRCDEAIAFYEKTVGAEIVMRMRWKDAPDQSMCSPDNAEKIMHACVKIGGSSVLASDGRCEGKPKFEGFALSYTVPDAAAAEKAFNALSDGGQVQMPLAKTFFSPSFGMCADKFGVSWMVYVEA